MRSHYDRYSCEDGYQDSGEKPGAGTEVEAVFNALRDPSIYPGFETGQYELLLGYRTSGLLQKFSLGVTEEEDFLRKLDELRLNVTGRVEGIVVDFKDLNAETRSLVDINIFGEPEDSGYEDLARELDSGR